MHQCINTVKLEELFDQFHDWRHTLYDSHQRALGNICDICACTCSGIEQIIWSFGVAAIARCMVHVPDSVLTIKDFAGHVARLLGQLTDLTARGKTLQHL